MLFGQGVQPPITVSLLVNGATAWDVWPILAAIQYPHWGSAVLPTMCHGIISVWPSSLALLVSCYSHKLGIAQILRREKTVASHFRVVVKRTCYANWVQRCRSWRGSLDGAATPAREGVAGRARLIAVAQYFAR